MRRLVPILAAAAVLVLAGAGAWWFTRKDPGPAFPAPNGPVMQVTELCSHLPDAATSAAGMTALGWQPLPEDRYLDLGRAVHFAMMAGWSATQPDFNPEAEMAGLDRFAGYVRDDYTRQDRKDWYQLYTRPEGGFARLTRDARAPGLLECMVLLPDTADIDDFNAWLATWTVEAARSDWAYQASVALLREGPGFVTGDAIKVTDADRATEVLGARPEALIRAGTAWRAEVAK